jgi:hypothetical protein
MGRSRRLIHLALALLLAGCAAVQYNDPDPVLWIALYGAGSALLVLAAAGWRRRWAVLAVLASYVAVGVTVLPGFLEWLLHHPAGDIAASMSAEQPHIEASREFLGLVIAAACVAPLLRAGTTAEPPPR